ncbi:MAG: phosphoribosylformylglycinamidine synthase subunit PurL [Candidatus Thorarchaeota archaeon]|nr:phosphoribosylformylglycinamidine synthase subunit PurL [Candidatus Thorarchaeota archaeon]
MLTEEELAHATRVLGRTPNEVETAMLDVLWSEHCSYKSSKRWFHLFNTQGERVVLGPGEGAGLVDIGDGVLLGVHMESHNHPSQVDPYNGAATGVGGIIRDVVSQGCRAVALMNCLRFGMPTNPKNAYLLERVVRGISDYGNSVGIPTVGGEIEFDPSYDNNCLVNVICIGTIRPDKIVRSAAKTPGHLLVMFGSTTGRDGIAGVSFASETFSDTEQENRGAIQIGDPLSKKVVLDVLEVLIEESLIEGMQDFGGGGLTSCAGELAHRGGTGVVIDVDRVPLREQGMTAREIVISESQERMMVVVAPEKLERVLEVLEENDTPHAVVGRVTDDHYYTVLERGEVRARLPVSLLVEGFPLPTRTEAPLPPQTQSIDWFTEPADMADVILSLLGSINICDRSWVYGQYDQHVQSNTVIEPGDNAGVIEITPTKRVAVKSDCNSFWCLLDPNTGAANSAAESLRNIVAVGAEPVFIADCLNFGNPEVPESYWQFVEAVRGLGRFSHDLKIPVVGGNVSFYNESQVAGTTRRINPTPQILIAGVLHGERPPVRRDLCEPGASILLVGETDPELNGTEYQRLAMGRVSGVPPKYRPVAEARAMRAMLAAHRMGLIRSSNNVGRGGLAVALMKMLMNSEFGFRVSLDRVPGSCKSIGQVLLSESSARYLAEVPIRHQPEFVRIMRENSVEVCALGLTVREAVADFGHFQVPLDSARHRFRDGLRKHME